MEKNVEDKSVFRKERILIPFTNIDNDFSFTLGRVKYCKAHGPLKDHTHYDSMEIVYIEKGKQIYRVMEQEYIVNSGEFFVAFPNEVHSTGQMPEDKCILYYLIIDLNKLRHGFVGHNSEEGSTICKSLSNMKKRVFCGNSNIKTILDTMIKAYYEEHTFKKTMLRNLISDLLMNIINCQEKSGSLYKFNMQSVINYIQDHICDELEMTELAKAACLSVPRFKTNFRKQIGIPPREYVLRQKVDKAKELLQNTDKSITDIAYCLNFSSSQYFSTVFKRFTFMSPNRYKRKLFP